MTQTDLRGSKRPDSGTEDKEQMISHAKNQFSVIEFSLA